MGDEFITLSPFLFVAMGIYIILELWRINFYVNRWEIESLMLIPAMIVLLYLWIGVFSPPIEIARLGLRCVLAASLGTGCHVVYAYSKFLRKGGR